MRFKFNSMKFNFNSISIQWKFNGNSMEIELNLNFIELNLNLIELKLNFIELKLNFSIEYCYNWLAIAVQNFWPQLLFSTHYLTPTAVYQHCLYNNFIQVVCVAFPPR